MHTYDFHIGDYARDTGHLTLIEHGVYRLLLDRAYADEAPLPADVSMLARKIGARTAAEQKAVKTILEEFFVQLPEGWTHKRVEAEIQSARLRTLKAKYSQVIRWWKQHQWPDPPDLQTYLQNHAAYHDPVTGYIRQPIERNTTVSDRNTTFRLPPSAFRLPPSAIGTPMVPKGTDPAPEGWEEAMDALEGNCWRESIGSWEDLAKGQRKDVREFLSARAEREEMMALFNPDEASDSEPPAETSDATPPRKKKKGRGAGQDAAAQIYEFYPRKVGRDAALRAIQRRLDQGLEPVTLMAVTRLYAEATAKWPAEDRQFIPHPATWFNRGSYDDDPREWARSGPAESAQKKEGGAPPVLESAPAKQSKPPPPGLERAMAALYGADWAGWAPSWYGLTPSDRAKIEAWLAAIPEGGSQ